MDGYSGCPSEDRGPVLLPAIILVAVDAVLLLALHLGL